MDIENFVGRWTILNSTTSVIAARDQLRIKRKGHTREVGFRCESSNPATGPLWEAVSDCQWFAGGGEAGHLGGTISDAAGNNYPLVLTYGPGNPNLIHIAVVKVPIGGGEVATAGGGDGAGGAGGNDVPPH